MGQIDLLKNLYLIGTGAKKTTLWQQLHKNCTYNYDFLKFRYKITQVNLTAIKISHGNVSPVKLHHKNQYFKRLLCFFFFFLFLPPPPLRLSVFKFVLIEEFWKYVRVNIYPVPPLIFKQLKNFIISKTI